MSQQNAEVQARLRALPSVSSILQRPAVAELCARHGARAVTAAARAAVGRARERLLATGGEASVSDDEVVSALREAELGSLRPVLNATGVVLHTNLGRAPLAPEAIEAASRVASGFSTLEYDLEAGERGDRHGHVTELLRELTSAEDGVVVNNNAAALLLTLSALARGREVVISRGELVEIGGGFRVPDVMEQSGARLREVGTTNRTHLRDYEAAVGPETAALLTVHPSSFAIVGFTRSVSIAELAPLARKTGLPLIHDAGSGSMLDDEPGEPPIRAHVEAGADLVLFSGDKLLGGPQAGIVVGKQRLVELVRRHPLMRAVRPDKLCLAALHATLRLWRDDPLKVPLARLRAEPEASLEKRARALAAAVAERFPRSLARACPSAGKLGGGSSPLRELPGWAVRLEPEGDRDLAERLRHAPEPVIARQEGGAVWLDLRSVPEGDDARLFSSLAWALEARAEANRG